MGYQTVKQVPTLIDYFNAHRWWENTKPIRGRSVDLRPLAERRYADCYSIRKHPANQAIECVLYKTPVVSFMPDGEIHVNNGGWATPSTHMFIEEVLGTGVRVCGQRGKTVVKINGSVISLGANEVMRIRKNGSKYEVLNEQTHHSYRINRKGANIVRGRFKDFYDYFKGFIKLRAEETQGGHYGPMRTMINCTFTELADSLGAKDYWDKDYLTVCVDDWRGLTMKPGTYTGWHKVPKDEYESTVNKFIDLIKSDQPEESRHTNFHKAALILLSYKHSNLTENKGATDIRTTWLDVTPAKTTLDTTLFKWFAPEVLERYEVPKGKVPETKYNSWMQGENT
jgi:RNase P/RNase MRP subunit p29